MTRIPPELADNPDRLRWNDRYARSGYAPSFTPHPLAELALHMPLAAGPVLELAAGPSGSALLAAGLGRLVTAVDASDVALGLLIGEARRRRLASLVTVVPADLIEWRPPAGRVYALVLCTGYWDRAVFAIATGAVAVGGLLGWEAFTLAARRDHPGLPADWCLQDGEPASLLPASFEVVSQRDTGPEPAVRRRLLARRVTNRLL
ncbi:MAG: class I SAM-dependent methyltransferase [Streptosporangiaceae bacterium]